MSDARFAVFSQCHGCRWKPGQKRGQYSVCLRCSAASHHHGGEPLVGVTVTEKGGKSTVITDIDGNFSITVKPKSQLELSYIGFVPTTVQAKPNMTIKMVEDGKELNEVVVVGYGTQKKANLTGAVTSVDVNKSLGSRPIADAGRGLQGVVPGMNVVVPTGEVGSDPLIKIRGQVASINGNNNPLILLD